MSRAAGRGSVAGGHESTVYSRLCDVLATFDRNVCRKFSSRPRLVRVNKVSRPDTVEKMSDESPPPPPPDNKFRDALPNNYTVTYAKILDVSSRDHAIGNFVHLCYVDFTSVTKHTCKIEKIHVSIKLRCMRSVHSFE